ncbi:hypothetical protein AVEN_253012-1 [Araneus ventricosus]|uniref:UPAR/Ly6 domain-containing protein n=1 Tax=Araneus ventricosus TaxID=182803 RepID=A0A4Y2EYE9_ARAVE|nr:hypothetical protein AVEN_253012-1 [Araneus ventricosus]
MRVLYIYALDLVFLLPLMLGVDCTLEKLKCYQCEVRKSEQCTDEYLLRCPNDQAYDSCMTRIFKTKGEEAWIRKTCALAPCSLRDASQASGLGLDHCDRSQDEYDCVTCCKGDGCNTGCGAICRPVFAIISALLILTSFLGVQRYT